MTDRKVGKNMRDKLKAKIKHVETSLRYCGFALALASLAGCNMLTRISEVSDGPALSQIQNPMAKKNYQPVSLPMPSPLPTEVNRSKARTQECMVHGWMDGWTDGVDL